ncbi:MAG: orotate phosphoribosyltransferase [Deltaproteobacteria bacterium]|nr:orotate phosphoribosyltransferase [Deltaproteobacteria bacterium]
MSNDLTVQILPRLRQAAALVFWEAEAVRLNLQEPFELASGNRSPIYINCRQVISDRAFMALFVAAARSILERAGATFDAVAGGETAGIPFAAFLAQGLDRPMLYVRKKAKGYGIASKVEGKPPQGGQILLVEDLITDGGSKLGFVDALREAGGTVTDSLVLFDRQQGGGDTLAGHEVRLHSVTDRQTVLEVAQESGLLPVEDRLAVDAYFRDPEAWHQDRGFPYHRGK